MPVNQDQLTTDLDFLRSTPGWQSGDETQRRELARQVAIESMAAGQDPEQHQALVGRLWEEVDPRGRVAKTVDFMGTAVKEGVVSAAAMGPAVVFAAGDAAGLSDTGAGVRLKRGVADLGNAAVQTVKQFAPNDYQQQMGETLDALREEIHNGSVPVGLTRWLAGEEEAAQEPEVKPWVEALTVGLAGKAAKADTRLQLNPGLRKDAVTTMSEEDLRRSWLASDRNPMNVGVQQDGSQVSARDHLADYMVTLDPASWQAFVNRVTETESQHKTRVGRALTGEQSAMKVAEQMGWQGDLMRRGLEMQTSPIDMATAALPLLRGMKLLKAVQGGAAAGGVARGVALGAGKEALQEGVTQKLQDARATNQEVIEAAAMGAIGSGTIEGTMALGGRMLTSSDRGPRADDPAPTEPRPSDAGPVPPSAGATPDPTRPGPTGPEQSPPESGPPRNDATSSSGESAPSGYQWQPESVRRLQSGPETRALPQPAKEQAPYQGVDIPGVSDRWKGAPAQMPEPRSRIPDSPLGGRDILDFVNENPIALPRQGSEQGGDMDWQERYSLPKYYRRFLADQEGRGIDQVAQSAYEANLIPEPSPDALMGAVESAIQTRRQYRFEQRTRQASLLDEEKRVVRFEQAQAKLQGKADVVPFDSMQIGDELEVAGETMRVKHLTYDEDGYPQTITMEDGKKFGLLSFDANRQNGVLVDEFRPTARAQGSGEFLGVDELSQSVKTGPMASQDQAAQTHSSTPGGLTEADGRYLDAVNRGDMETAQRMVDEAAQAAGAYDQIFYFGARQERQVINTIGTSLFVTDDEEAAQDYGHSNNSPQRFYLFGDVAEIGDTGIDWSASKWNEYHTEDGEDYEDIDVGQLLGHQGHRAWLAKILKKDGWSALHFEGDVSSYSQIEHDSWLVVDDTKIKSADPVTRDDQGNIIPLSKRFDQGNDIRGDVSFDTSAPALGAEELSRSSSTASAFERASLGDDAAFEDLDALLRSRYGQEQPVSSAEELGRQVFTQAAFEQLFEQAFAAKDFDAILEAMKQSDRAVYAPLLKRFFAEQADNPQSAMKAEWMRHVFNGTRPADAVAPKQGAGSTGQGATTQAPPRQTASSTQPPQSAPKAGKAPPSSPPPRAPRIPVKPIVGRLAKSPYQIINDYSKAIGKLFQVRRLKPAQLGVYRPGSTMTANRFAGDLDTAAHELAGHWTDDKHGLGKPWMNDKTSPYDAELAGFWIHGSPSNDMKIKRAEGIAEFFRAYIMDPVTTIKQAPKFSAYVEQTLPKDALAALNQFSDDVRTWAGENPLRRAGLNIRMERPSVKERLYKALFGDGREFSKSWVDELAARFSDNYHYAVKGFETALRMQGKSIKNLKPSENFDLLVRWLSGHENRFSEQLENGLTPLQVTQVEIDPTTGKPFPPGSVIKLNPRMEVQRLTDPVTGQPMNLAWLLEAFDTSSKAAQDQDARDASALMVAERTLERGRQIDAEAQAQITPTTTPKQRAAILAEAERAKSKISGLGAGMMSDVQAANQAITALNQDPNKAKRLREAARRYRAWANANLELMVEGGRMTREQVDAIKAANTQYVDMHRLSEEFEVESMVAQSKGGSLGTAKELMKRFKGSTLEIDNVYASLLKQTEAIQKEVARNRVMQTFVQQLESARGLYDGAAVELDRIGSKVSSEDRNTMTVYRNGKAEFWKLDKDIHAAIKGFGELGSNELLDVISKVTGVIRYVITRSPAFAIRNPLRDTIQRSVVSHSAARPWDILRGYTDADKRRMQAFGGGMFGHYGKDRFAWNKELERGMKEMRKDPRNILMTPLELWKGWERMLEASETLGRVAEFRKAYDKGVKELGYTPDEAALYAAGEARGLLDFAKMGTWMRQINKVIPFSNAAVRGLARSASGFMEDPVGFGVRWTLFVAMPTLAVRMLAKQMGGDVEEEYQQLPAWQRDFFWNVKVGSYWLRIPKPYELGVMAGGVERALSRELGEKNSFDGYGGSVLKAMLPVGDFPSLLGPLKAPAEVAFNRDTFRDRDIVPIWERDLKLDLRKGANNASMVGQSVGRMLGVDPRNIDHLMGSFGGLGTSVVDFTRPERKLGESALKATGLVLPTISSQSKDYQWVVDWAKANGKLGEKHVKALRDLAQEVYKAKTPQEADDLAKLVRRQATAIRVQVSGR